MCKIDLHTHSLASPDGSLTEAHYRHMLEQQKLDVIAVTDHNRIDFAQKLHAALGDRIIVGEEITTADGELIGLYLQEVVPAGLSAAETVRHIKQQGGIVYVPHPFETVRKGISHQALAKIAKDVDIIETHNGRAFFQKRTVPAEKWAAAHHTPGAASSDAHGVHGWGKTFSELHQVPTRATLVALLGRAHLHVSLPTVRAILYPKVNRLRKKIPRGPHA